MGASSGNRVQKRVKKKFGVDFLKILYLVLSEKQKDYSIKVIFIRSYKTEFDCYF